jgi:hypothetical protein
MKHLNYPAKLQRGSADNPKSHKLMFQMQIQNRAAGRLSI